MTRPPAPTTLSELFHLLKSEQLWQGAPELHGELDWPSLPTFGGTCPVDTAGVWSWDEEYQIEGAGIDGLVMAEREDTAT